MKFPTAATALLTSLVLLATPTTAAKSSLTESYYRPNDPVKFECLNRTVDTGEHVSDQKGHLQYVPFFPCLEATKTPFSVPFLTTSQINCTIPSLSDELFHLFEFYLHADSPLQCRVPARPKDWGERSLDVEGSEQGDDGVDWVPVVFSLVGNIELSHVHIVTDMNLLFHLTDPTLNTPTITSATAYSINADTSTVRIKIGDPLPLKFNVRWYDSTQLPPSSHLARDKAATKGWHLMTFLTMSFLAGAAAAATLVLTWWMPRKMKGGLPMWASGAPGGSAGLRNGAFGPGYGKRVD
ncbi:hypothetical protein BJ508DRAFT_417846 [Ascobolus immersus RN42]|uniref:Autophagy-related protein 27 n=1 Tax=Ascobolus immersus RN42 TaxID=1160509 RepID=A0A3N4HQ35_ASCIM|nr:hypothetical protein BJ508DRAFT_417846 [Ascobolus immersus RN42]